MGRPGAQGTGQRELMAARTQCVPLSCWKARPPLLAMAVASSSLDDCLDGGTSAGAGSGCAVTRPRHPLTVPPGILKEAEA